MAQVRFTAACNAQHHVEERVCRLLLEIHDRIGTAPIPLKQVTIAQLLGLRWTTVTMVLVKLERGRRAEVQSRLYCDTPPCRFGTAQLRMLPPKQKCQSVIFRCK